MRHAVRVQAGGGDRLNDCGGEPRARGFVQIQDLVGEGRVVRPFERREEKLQEKHRHGRLNLWADGGRKVKVDVDWFGGRGTLAFVVLATEGVPGPVDGW